MAVSLKGTLNVPGDKSITHRAIMFGAVANGTSTVRTSLLGRDNFATARVMCQLGAKIKGTVTNSLLAMAHEEGLTNLADSGNEWCDLEVTGAGFEGLHAPAAILDCGNSGTTARLLTGVLAGRPFSATLTGDKSLVKRPFKRVAEPLTKMGAKFSGDMLPLTVTGGKLGGLEYASPKASAQVKSAILLAGLQGAGRVSVTEPELSRDHTERMLRAMGCAVEVSQISGGWRISLPDSANRGRLNPLDVVIPGDISAAAFFLVAGSIFPDSELTITGVGVNATRTGIISVLERMGARLELKNKRDVGGEDVVDIGVRTARLRGCDIGAKDVVLAIDEVPVLAVAAALAEGTTRIEGAAELRVKESDRLAMSAAILRSFGVEVEEFDDGLEIIGKPELATAGAPALKERPDWKTSHDHRIAMCGALLELLATGDFDLPDKPAVETSFPRYEELLRGLISR